MANGMHQSMCSNSISSRDKPCYLHKSSLSKVALTKNKFVWSILFGLKNLLHCTSRLRIYYAGVRLLILSYWFSLNSAISLACVPYCHQKQSYCQLATASQLLQFTHPPHVLVNLVTRWLVAEWSLTYFDCFQSSESGGLMSATRPPVDIATSYQLPVIGRSIIYDPPEWHSNLGRHTSSDELLIDSHCSKVFREESEVFNESC